MITLFGCKKGWPGRQESRGHRGTMDRGVMRSGKRVSLDETNAGIAKLMEPALMEPALGFSKGAAVQQGCNDLPTCTRVSHKFYDCIKNI